MSQETVEFESVGHKLLAETATISWHELQRFYAQGAVLMLDSCLDLVAVATLFAEDRASEIEPLLLQSKLKQPSTEQARAWYADDASLWSVVVAPYVLVQERDVASSTEKK